MFKISYNKITVNKRVSKKLSFLLIDLIILKNKFIINNEEEIIKEAKIKYNVNLAKEMVQNYFEPTLEDLTKDIKILYYNVV